MEERGIEEVVTPAAGVVRPVTEAIGPELTDELVESSKPFVGRWSRLVSTTNWEKGRIIAEWRASLEDGGAAVTDYSDEAWAHLVGHVTGQHVGRLRRVHQRFAAARDEYDGLYWSHFQAALDWDDAELWLEGATKNAWSVSKMRAARWEASGAPADTKPADGDIHEASLDEDAYATLMGREPQEADRESAPAGERPAAAEAGEAAAESPSPEAEAVEPPPKARPFERIGELPDDVAEAFEQFKLAILNHKLAGWSAISREEIAGCLDALKVLAAAPSDDG